VQVVTLNDEVLMDVIVQTLLFLELNDDTIIDEDAAVEMMEQMAFTLQNLCGISVTTFRKVIMRRNARCWSRLQST
jgi:hypothetical protein